MAMKPVQLRHPVVGAHQTPDPSAAVTVAHYALCKARTFADAVAILSTIPMFLHRKVLEHARSRPHMYTPDVLAAVKQTVYAPQQALAEAAFIGAGPTGRA